MHTSDLRDSSESKQHLLHGFIKLPLIIDLFGVPSLTCDTAVPWQVLQPCLDLAAGRPLIVIDCAIISSRLSFRSVERRTLSRSATNVGMAQQQRNILATNFTAKWHNP